MAVEPTEKFPHSELHKYLKGEEFEYYFNITD